MGAFDFKFPPLDQIEHRHVDFRFDANPANTLWVSMKSESEAGHHFSLPLLHDLRAVGQALQTGASHCDGSGRLETVNYAVMRSAHPEYFSLGGDLRLFRSCIMSGDRNRLRDYSRLCLEVMHAWGTRTNPELTTVSLVQGRALGGGFEAALAADYLIAEEQSSFGFPEIMFGLFPCTGAMSLLLRRVPVYQAQRMMTSGKVYSAMELQQMGLIDEVCAQGDGVAAVERYIARHSRQRAARLSVRRAMERMSPLDMAELLQVVDDWVDLALALTPSELRVMDMLIRMQYGMQAECRQAASTPILQLAGD
jgi:DSF synthase